MSHAKRNLAGAPPKVLVVDDNAVDRELVARMLSPQLKVLEAATVETGLAAFSAEHPDCVLLDHHMPGRSGLDGLVDFVSAHAVVIMMSGVDTDDLAAEAFKRGAHDFIRKEALTEAWLVRTITRERERRLLESALRATQRRFDEVAARIAEVLWVRSLDGEFLYLSPAFEQIWGRPRAGMTLALWESYVHPEDAALGQAARDSFRDGKEYELEYRIVRPDGQTRRIHNRGYPIIEDGVLARYGGITRDVTEEARLQQELRLAQKLEAIGQLAAGVAHEINTPAQYVSDNVTFLSESFRTLLPLLAGCRDLALRAGATGPEEIQALGKTAADADLEYLVAELPAALEQTAAGVGQIKKIVKAMKEFSHPADDTKVIDLNHAIETTVTVARNEWKYVADVKLDLAPDLPAIACNPSEINQVLLNLIVNSAQAIGDVVGGDGKTKGEIAIGTRADDDCVVITVADTGGGIPEAIRHKVFDPFFTTKAIGKGTGQGLAITHRIVTERHGGSITFDSTVGKGTQFEIRLPRVGPAEALPLVAATTGRRGRG
jgi:two-component system, NtrC family, sensor kinase